MGLAVGGTRVGLGVGGTRVGLAVGGTRVGLAVGGAKVGGAGVPQLGIQSLSDSPAITDALDPGLDTAPNNRELIALLSSLSSPVTNLYENSPTPTNKANITNKHTQPQKSAHGEPDVSPVLEVGVGFGGGFGSGLGFGSGAGVWSESGWPGYWGRYEGFVAPQFRQFL